MLIREICEDRRLKGLVRRTRLRLEYGMRPVSKVKETEFKSLNDMWEYMISQVGWTEALSGDEAMGKSRLFATFFHSVRRGRDTCG